MSSVPLTPDQIDRVCPKYTPTHTPVPGQKGDGLMIEAEGLMPANIPGQRNIGTMKDPDQPGRRVQLSVPHIPYERWIDEAGNLLCAVIRTNRVMKKNGRGSTDDGNFKSQMERERLKAGWVRYDDGLGKPSSFDDVNGKKVIVTEWTPEVREALMVVRKKEQAEIMNHEAKPWLDKVKRESETVMKAMTEALQTFAEGTKQRQARAAKLAELDK